ncbi:MAG: hypothetical protein HDKAJFGB_00558 [Anaerolineae bacterium]|nr:hypothetical protein [Anaerolineae bacterium]
MERAHRPARPLAVTIVVLFILLQMIVAVVTWLDAVKGLGITSFSDLSSIQSLTLSPDNFVAIVTALALPLLEIFAVVIIFGLLKIKWWALTCALLLQGLILTLGLMAFLRGDIVAARNILPVINVILLNQTPVRRAFGEKVGLYE